MSKDDQQIIQQARQQLALGFHIRNLYDLTKLFREMARSTRWPTACFILSEVSLTLANDWEGRPVSVDEARNAEDRLRPLFVEVLDLIDNPMAQELLPALDRLVITLLNLKT